MREPIGIVATLRELERRNKPAHIEEADEEPEVCRGYHVSSRDPEFDPPGHDWQDKPGPDGTTWRICRRCGAGDEC